MEYLREIIKELEDGSTIEEINDLFENLNNQLINEDFNDLELNIESMIGCSQVIPLQDFPTPMGTNFFSIYNPLQAVNAIIPDLFRLCAIIKPDKFMNVIESTRICPKIAIKFEDPLSTSSQSRLQFLIPSYIMKSFFYFGYKGDFSKMDLNSITFLEKKIETIVQKSASNSSNYTTPESIYNQLYDQDTIINSIINLNNVLNSVKKEETDSTTISTYNLNYPFTYYDIFFVTVDSSNYSNNYYGNVNDKNNTALSYSDLVYLNYLRSLLADDLNLQSFINILTDNIMNIDISPTVINNFKLIIDHIKENNIFNIISAALEVKQYILNVISYNLNNKVYKIAEYAQPKYLGLTKRLYCNYSTNLNYLYPELDIPAGCL